MRNWKILVGCAAVSVLVLAGCTSRLTPADRDLLNRALDAGQEIDQSVMAAQTAAQNAEDSADRAEAAATRAENAAQSAEASAAQAAASAEKAARAFEMGQMK